MSESNSQQALPTTNDTPVAAADTATVPAASASSLVVDPQTGQVDLVSANYTVLSILSTQGGSVAAAMQSVMWMAAEQQ